jgi:phage terminase small subunit
MAKELNIQQHKFIEYYVECGNATTAAGKAGYSQPNLYGAQLLMKQVIIEAIREAKDKLAAKSLVTKLELVMELKQILDNTKETSPKTAIEAIKTLNKMLGFEAPIQSEITMVQEQPLFGLINEDIDYIDGGMDELLELGE